jgi:hypothetical protein
LRRSELAAAPAVQQLFREMHVPDEEPPVGSGYFAKHVGIGFFVVSVIIGDAWYWGPDFKKIDPIYVLETWIVACSVILVYWGQVRINHS